MPFACRRGFTGSSFGVVTNDELFRGVGEHSSPSSLLIPDVVSDATETCVPSSPDSDGIRATGSPFGLPRVCSTQSRLDTAIRGTIEKTYRFVQTVVMSDKFFVLFPGANVIVRYSMENFPINLRLQARYD